MADVVKLSPRTQRELDGESAALDGDGLLRSNAGVIKACEHNGRVLIATDPEYADLHLDEFLSRMRLGGRDWTDADDIECVCRLQSKYGVARFTLGQARSAARVVAHSRGRDSLREFVEGLPAWDGVERINSAFVDAWGAPDTPLTRAASQNFFIAMIARALRPGSQVDTLFVLEGPQGTFKSRSLRELGGDFHAEITAPIGTADFLRELRGVWLAELSELDALRGREASTVKRILSAPKDRFVQKYATHADTYLRRAVAVATTNEATYWQDSTGARRLVPITCTNIRVDAIVANRLQWFAEARQRYAAGCTWWEFPAGIADAQEQRQQVDPWEDILRECMARGRRWDSDAQSVTLWPHGAIASAELMRDWLRLEPHHQAQASSTRLGRVMRRLGYEPVRIGHARVRGWQPADVNSAPNDGAPAGTPAPLSK
jgi:putative DNA primase/helicase